MINNSTNINNTNNQLSPLTFHLSPNTNELKRWPRSIALEIHVLSSERNHNVAELNN